MTSKTCESKGKEDCEEESEEEDWEWWTNPLEELSDMVDVFETEDLKGKTILDVGTDCVKPLYIALKYEPHKIIGITLDKPRFAGNIADHLLFDRARTIILDDCHVEFGACPRVRH